LLKNQVGPINGYDVRFEGVHVVSTAYCILVCLLHQSPIDLPTLLEKHEEGVSRIHSLRASIVMRVSPDGGKTWKVASESTIIKSGERELLHGEIHYLFVGSDLREAPGFRDHLTTREGRWSLVGYDPKDPPAEPVDTIERQLDGQRKITAQIDGPQPFSYHGYKGDAGVLLMHLPDVRYTVRDLCAATANPRLSVERGPNNTVYYTLRLKSPKKDEKDVTFHLTIDASKNYAISSRELTDRDGRPFPYFQSLKVIEFQEPKPGIFLPRVLRGSSPDGESFIPEILIKDVTVNEPIPQDVFKLRFPSGIIVLDTTQGNCLHLWGDGVPERTFKTPQEYGEWRDALLAAAQKRRRSHKSWPTAALLVSASTAILVGLIVARRRLLAKA
jgi:hypothetical protein